MNEILKAACARFDSVLFDGIERLAEKLAQDAASAPGAKVDPAYSSPAPAPPKPAASAPAPAPPSSTPRTSPGSAPAPVPPKTENRTFTQKGGKWFSGDKPATDDEVRQIDEYQKKNQAPKPPEPKKGPLGGTPMFKERTPEEQAKFEADISAPAPSAPKPAASAPASAPPSSTPRTSPGSAPASAPAKPITRTAAGWGDPGASYSALTPEQQKFRDTHEQTGKPIPPPKPDVDENGVPIGAAPVRTGARAPLTDEEKARLAQQRRLGSHL